MLAGVALHATAVQADPVVPMRASRTLGRGLGAPLRPVDAARLAVVAAQRIHCAHCQSRGRLRTSGPLVRATGNFGWYSAVTSARVTWPSVTDPSDRCPATRAPRTSGTGRPTPRPSRSRGQAQAEPALGIGGGPRQQSGPWTSTSAPTGRTPLKRTVPTTVPTPGSGHRSAPAAAPTGTAPSTTEAVSTKDGNEHASPCAHSRRSGGDPEPTFRLPVTCSGRWSHALQCWYGRPGARA